MGFIVDKLNMAIHQQNPFLEAFKALLILNVEDPVNAVLQAWTQLLEEGHQQEFLNRNVMARVCEHGYLDLLMFLIENDYVFDKLCVYICAYECDLEFLCLILNYQPNVMDGVNLQHLLSELEKKVQDNPEIQSVIDFFKDNFVEGNC